jgi:ribokinase
VGSTAGIAAVAMSVAKNREQSGRTSRRPRRTSELAAEPPPWAGIGPAGAARREIDDIERPIVVVGGHSQSLFMRVTAIPREGETVAGHGYLETIDGGKATNQAVAAARLGAPVRFVSVLGSDSRGEWIMRYLDARGVDRRWTAVVDGPTDVGFVMLPPGGVPAIASCVDLSLRLDGDFVRRARGAFGGASVVVCQLEARPSCAEVAFALAREVGAITIFNPAPMMPLPSGLLELTDVLVPNEHEASILVGEQLTVPELAARLASVAPWAQVIVTAGADGAYLGLPEATSLHFESPSVPTVDTTGAGDAFVGALARCLRMGIAIEEAAAFAVQAAALSVSRSGTLEAFLSEQEIRAPVPCEGG